MYAIKHQFLISGWKLTIDNKRFSLSGFNLLETAFVHISFHLDIMDKLQCYFIQITKAETIAIIWTVLG